MMIVGDVCEECRLSTTGYCVKHTPQVTFTPVQTTITWPPTFTLTPFPFVAQGWQCPLCRMVYAPHVPSCGCASHVSVYTTTSSARSA